MTVIKANQIKQLQIICKDKFSDREQRLEDFSKVLGYRIHSSKDLSEIELSDLIHYYTTGNYRVPKSIAYFDKDNTQHRHIISLAIQNGWRDREKPTFASLHVLGCWIRSKRCPVQGKDLKQMTPKELSKVISALEQIIVKKYK